jgi:hypothetical protein
MGRREDNDRLQMISPALTNYRVLSRRYIRYGDCNMTSQDVEIIGERMICGDVIN